MSRIYTFLQNTKLDLNIPCETTLTKGAYPYKERSVIDLEISIF